eukprot:9796099-Alexandrium_andersonii.AAC.1
MPSFLSATCTSSAPPTLKVGPGSACSLAECVDAGRALRQRSAICRRRSHAPSPPRRRSAALGWGPH